MRLLARIKLILRKFLFKFKKHKKDEGEAEDVFWL